MATVLGLEDLRKQARHLENEIDVKLVSFSKLGSTHSHHKSSDTEPLLNSEHDFEDAAAEIEDLLNKLQNINERMNEQPVGGAAMVHTLQRHRDILRDYRHEYDRTCANRAARQEREELLRTVRSEHVDTTSSAYKAATGLNRRDMYLKESQHLHSSDRLINDQISIAVETREHLVSQRQSFKRLQMRFNDMTNRFPAINSLLQRINIRKRRDSIIVGLVVACCTFLILFYAFH